MFETARTVRLADTDAAGVVYFARTLEWCHDAYEAWLESVDLSLGRLLPASELVLPIVHAEVTHDAPLVLGDELTVVVARERVGRTSYTLAFLVKHAGRIAARASTTHVCIDRSSREPTEIPAEIRTELGGLAEV